MLGKMRRIKHNGTSPAPAAAGPGRKFAGSGHNHGDNLARVL
jgi:hypothetical protein